MSRHLKIHRAGPAMSLQDQGRSGWRDLGLSRGGAADRLALAEAAALLGQSDQMTSIEMTGMGGEFEASEDMRIALTGAPMRASLDGTKLVWNASHLLPAGARLSLGSTLEGSYGYLTLGGANLSSQLLGATSAHLAAGIGQFLQAGDSLEIGPDGHSQTGMVLTSGSRFSGGPIRMVESFHSHLFSQEERLRFQATAFKRDARSNRMAVRLDSDTKGFQVEGGRNIVSEVIMPGDIQVTGDGTPYVLMSECQTTGGYPRIGTVLPCDLPKLAQAMPGAPLQFRFVELEEAIEVERAAASAEKALSRAIRPLIRDPRTIPDLLSYQLISGVTAGYEE